jgi:hypothetical protein
MHAIRPLFHSVEEYKQVGNEDLGKDEGERKTDFRKDEGRPEVKSEKEKLRRTVVINPFSWSMSQRGDDVFQDAFRQVRDR